jgi:hypothetical protein
MDGALNYRITFRKWHENANTPHSLCLLRVRRQRPRRCAAEQ